MIAVNQTAVFLVLQTVAKKMVTHQQGKIINIGSIQSEQGCDTITPYADSKGGLTLLTRGMCVELAHHNIQVNAIAPGYFVDRDDAAADCRSGVYRLADEIHACRRLEKTGRADRHRGFPRIGIVRFRK